MLFHTGPTRFPTYNVRFLATPVDAPQPIDAFDDGKPLISSNLAGCVSFCRREATAMSLRRLRHPSKVPPPTHPPGLRRAQTSSLDEPPPGLAVQESVRK
jgi:hypothetical protein